MATDTPRPPGSGGLGRSGDPAGPARPAGGGVALQSPAGTPATHSASGPGSVPGNGGHDPAPGDLTGHVIGPGGKYRLLSVIARGGMGTVYEAEQLNVPRKVAIKVADPSMATQADFVRRFHQEIGAVAQLEHEPHILPVHDVGDEDGLLYMVMPLVRGGTLKDRLEHEPGRPWAPEEALPVARQVLAALDYAHERGLIHRDVKPSNILFDGERVYLADFGIAKVLQDADGAPVVGPTLTGVALMGTPTYMAPEQALGLPIDRRADIYAFGVVLYEMLTGRPPYKALTPLQTAFMHVEAALPPPRQVNPSLPPEIEEVLLTALSRHADQRYLTARIFSAAFERAVSAAGSVSVAPPPGGAPAPGTATAAPAAGPPAAVPGGTGERDEQAVAPAESGRDQEVAARAAQVQAFRDEVLRRLQRVQQTRAALGVQARPPGSRLRGEPSAAPPAPLPPLSPPRPTDAPVAPGMPGARSAPSTTPAAPAPYASPAASASPPAPAPPAVAPRPPVVPPDVAMPWVTPPPVAPPGAVGSPVAPPITPMPRPADTEVAPATTPFQAPAGTPQVQPGTAGPQPEPWWRTRGARRGALAVGVLAIVGAGIASRWPRPGSGTATVTVVPPTITPTPRGPFDGASGPMIAGRSLHTATLLKDGRVLVAGGQDGRGTFLDSVELYDPATGRWSSTAHMGRSRADHTATLLLDGKVLLAGGRDGEQSYLGAVEVYDPATGQWASVDSLSSTRAYHTATLLSDGRVLVSGGHNDSLYQYTSELYDPQARRWRPGPRLDGVRTGHAAAPVGAGDDVLVCGGTGESDASTVLATCELFSLKDEKWADVAPLSQRRDGLTLTTLQGGRVLALGGFSYEVRDGRITPVLPPQVELFDPATRRWTGTAPLTQGRTAHVSTVLSDGSVLVTGGQGVGADGRPATLASAELFDPKAGTWRAVPAMPRARAGHTATLLPDGYVLVAGGRDGELSPRATDRYDPRRNVWVPGQDAGQ